MNTNWLAQYFPQLFAKGQPRQLTVVSPLEESSSLVIDGDTFADLLPRKVVPGTAGAVFFKSAIHFVANTGTYTLDNTIMVIPDEFLDVPVGKKANATKVRLTGDILISNDALQGGTDVYINVMTFVVLSDGNVVFLPVSGVSEAKVAFTAPRPRALK